MGSAPSPIVSILEDLRRSLENLTSSLTQSNGIYHPNPPAHPITSSPLPQALPPNSHPQSFVPKLNPLPQPPNEAISHGSSAPPIRPSYTDIIRADILSQPATQKPHHLPAARSNPSTRPPTAKNPASIKLARMRSLTEKGIPVCYRCGEQGHHTSSCRNPLICFRCRQTGHRATTCKLAPKPLPQPLPNIKLTQPSSSSQIPPPSLKIPSFSPDSLPPVTMFPRPTPTPEKLQEASILPPIRFHATPATTQFRRSLNQGVVFTDTRRLGAHYIQAHLHRLFPVPQWTWIARELSDNQFLVAPPDTAWRSTVLRDRHFVLGDIPFPVQSYDFNRFNKGNRLKNYWVQVFDYPHDLWREAELNHLARELGGILIDTDPRSLEHTNLNLTRIKIAVPDKEVIPACRYLVFTNDTEEPAAYLIQTLVEDDNTALPWGHSRSQIFNANHKRPRSPSPTLPSPPTNIITSFQPVSLHIGDIPGPSTRSPIPLPNPMTITKTSTVPPPAVPLSTATTGTSSTPNPSTVPAPAPPPPAPQAPTAPPQDLTQTALTPPVQPTPQLIVNSQPSAAALPIPATEIPIPEIPIPHPVDHSAPGTTQLTVPPTARTSRTGSRLQPTISEEARHSLRLKAKEGAPKNKGGKSGASSGNIIISTFPYIHLTDSELIELYSISGFYLGSDLDEQLSTVQKLRNISISRFQSSFSDILSVKNPVPTITPTDLTQLILDASSVVDSPND